MEQIMNPMREFLAFATSSKINECPGPSIRMSDINHSFTETTPAESFNLTENFKNIRNQIGSEYERADKMKTESKQQSNEVLSEELNDLDFKKFVNDLSGSGRMKNTPPTTRSPPRSRIIYERMDHKETIIIDNITCRNSDNVHVVKVQITLPGRSSVAKGLKAPAISTSKSTHQETKGHHLPIMGKAALMAKLRSGNQKGNDSEIIRDLVTQRFQKFLNTYHEKTFTRQNSRVSRIGTPEDSEGPRLQSQQQAVLDNLVQSHLSRISSIQSTSLEASESTIHSASFCSEMTSLGVNDEGKLVASLDDQHSLSKATECGLSQMDLTFAKNNFSKLETLQIKDTHLLEYDATQFLKEALGDELNNYRSPDVSAIQNNSIGTSNISTLISATSRYEQVTYDSAVYEDAPYPCDPVMHPTDQKRDELLVQSDAQNMIIVQIAKAVTFCKITKEFSGSAEEMEAERILLIATCKRDAIQDEIRRLEDNDARTNRSNSRGSVTIRSVVLPPRQRNPLLAKMLDKRRKQLKRDFSDWYLCIFSHGLEVLASRAIQPDEDGFLRFDDEVRFGNLRLDFEICIAIYVMKVHNPPKAMSHESKFHLKSDKTRMCPLSPPKLFNSGREMKTMRIPNDVHQKSSYRLGGKFHMKINDLGHLGHFKLTHFSLMYLQSSFAMDFCSSVHINEDYSGFLDVGLLGKDCILWNRRWCSLNGPALAYFNCPGEESPLGVIELQYCPCARIGIAERRICARPRTLLIKVLCNNDDTSTDAQIRQYFLAADSKQYMEMWENKLNATLDTLRNWNVMKCLHSERNEKNIS